MQTSTGLKCSFQKERGKDKGKLCGKEATDMFDGKGYCHVHHQIVSGRRAKDLNRSAPIPIPRREKKEEEMSDVTQIAFVKEDGIDKGRSKNKLKRKATREASSESDTDSDEEIDEGVVYNWIHDNGNIDFKALEKASMAAFRKGAGLH